MCLYFGSGMHTNPSKKGNLEPRHSVWALILQAGILPQTWTRIGMFVITDFETIKQYEAWFLDTAKEDFIII